LSQVPLKKERAEDQLLMIPFPADSIHDEDQALDWWENVFAECGATLGCLVEADRLAKAIVGSIKAIRGAAMHELLTLSEAGKRTGRTPDHIGRLVRLGQIPNAGRKNAPRVRYADLINAVKPKLARSKTNGYDPASDARSLRVRR
jgi:hypothetical protein